MNDFWASPVDSTWDKLILGSTTMPGLCYIDTDSSRDIQIAKEKKKDGAHLRDNGMNASPVKATLILWTKEQFDELDRVLPKFLPRKPGIASAPFDIVHPATRLMGVSQVTIRRVRVTTPVVGQLRVDFDMIEWFEPSAIKASKRKKKIEAIDGISKGGKQLTDEDISVPSRPSQTRGMNL